MKRYVLSTLAERDLNQTIAFLIDEAGPVVARRMLHEIRDAIRLIARYPGLGHRRRDITQKPLKFWLVHAYLIVYDAAPRPIEIVRIVHGSRHLSSLV